MSIKTDSIPYDKPKTPENCTVFKLFSLIADDEKIKKLEKNYLSGKNFFTSYFNVISFNIIKNYFTNN